MLKKFIAIKNVGRFRNSQATGNPQLLKHVLVLGANGFGKTTLCAILRSLQSGDPTHIIGRRTLGAGAGDPDIELLIDPAVNRFNAGGWNHTCPEIIIFDSTFVSENIHSGDVVDLEQKRSLYRVIIGQEGVALADEDASLAGASRTKTAEITAAARALQPYFPPGIRLEQFLPLAADAGIDAKIAEQTRTRDAVRESQQITARAALGEFTLPTVPDALEAVLARTIDGIAEDAERRVATHLATHEMTARGSWVAEGMPSIVDEKCPFCGQAIAGLPLIRAYRSVFSDAYREFRHEITTLGAQIARDFGDATLGQLDTRAADNRGARDFWQRYCALNEVTIDLPAELRPAIAALRDALTALLARKAQAPLDPVAFDAAATDALARFTDSRAGIEILNAKIRAANAVIAAKKQASAAGNLQAAEAALNYFLAVKKRHEPEVAAACTAYAGLVAAKDVIDVRKIATRDRLDAHTNQVVTPYELRINELLDDFNAGFRITKTTHGFPGGIASSSYQLLINRVAVDLGDGNTGRDRPSFKNTLSAGDRTTLALAFFIAHLERDPNRANRIVVFDDPFSSQDAFRRQQTVFEIKRTADSCAQVVVLSHDAAFLRQVWNKSPAATRIALQLADAREQGVKIVPCDLEELCKGRAASEVDDLIAYYRTGTGTPRDIVKKMRIALETYCRATYPASFAPADMLGGMVEKIRQAGEAHPTYSIVDELDQINEYSREHHHGEDPGDGVADQIDDTELKGFVRRTLRLINALQA